MGAVPAVRPGRAVAGRLALVASLAAGFAAATAPAHAAPPALDPVRPEALTPAEEQVYRERIRLLTGGRALDPTGVALYQPLEEIPGARNHQPLPVRPAAERTISAAALEAARGYAARNNSGSLLVWRAGALELAAFFGGRDATSPVISRSLAKPVTAVAVGRALETRQLRSLDQPVADYLPEWQGAGPRSRILVRHLLDMRGGFLAQGPSLDPASIWTRAYLSPRHEAVLIHEYPLTHEPGTRYEYANAPSDLVAVLLERATGLRYAEFLSREVFEPLGSPGGRVWINRPGGVAHAGCCLLAPAEFWLRLGILLLRDGQWEGRRLLPAGYVAAMRTPTAENPWAGLGVYVAGPYAPRRGPANPDLDAAPKTLHAEPYLDRDLFLFDGNSSQVVYLVPALDMVVVRTGDEPPREPEWDNSYLPNVLIRGARPLPGQAAPVPQGVPSP